MASIVDEIIKQSGKVSLTCDDAVLRADILSQLNVGLPTDRNYSNCSIEIDAVNTLDDNETFRSGLLILENEILVENIHVRAKYYKTSLNTYAIIYENYAIIQFSLDRIQIKYLDSALRNNYHPIYTPYLFCTSILFEIASIQGNLIVHASCVEMNSRGILFLAKKGSGKSTLSLALSYSKGFGYLSDDKVIYNQIDNKLLTAPDVIRLNKDVYEGYFSKLMSQPHDNNIMYRDKHVLNVNNLPLRFVRSVVPSIIILPSIIEKDKYFDCKKIDAISLVKELLHHRIVAFEDRENLINVALYLIKQCRCFSIEMGQCISENINNIVKLIARC
ncbi:MAG: hypothetical protein PHV14_08885 [Bacteroidales bacterium]|jgi:hypothetical protein|nr:hypothetical protein [Clostridia bacterium]MDD2683302.1 hypothetical protein [Candidatus Cloacimonadota bacterium]MDD3092668.1 hypothetical protein [Clostridia bacterium]MDD3812384.1 hypothetical protein [Bacteroidales bacterium]MDD3971471.1 hypothetical protein [Clostridia bacterium]